MADSMPAGLERPVTALKGVGPALAARLEKLSIRTLQDLLFHLPLRYQDRTRVLPIGGLRPGDEVVVEGEVELAEVVLRRRRALLVRVADGTGFITLRFFYFNASQREGFRRGARVRCFGEVRRGPRTLEMVHPEYRLLSGEGPAPVEETLTPVYPTTEGLSQKSLRRLTDQVLGQMREGGLRDWLPKPLRDEFDLSSIAEALFYVHRPPPEAPVALLREVKHPHQRRLAFEELLAHNLSLQQLRAGVRRNPAPAVVVDGALANRFIAGLPFALTAAQRRVIGEIVSDMTQPFPMLRLVQGDVGSGKTVVAAAAALHAVEGGFQAALMAPTELLAEQHYRNLCVWLEPLGVQVAWLSGTRKGKAREQTLLSLAQGGARVVVGTHALFQEGVEFHDLALVIVDEQHRFGVHQRMALREKGSRDGRFPHQLIMTATPIPRTLAMTAYADLDLSVIDELPPGRTPVVTAAVPDDRRNEVIERVRRACADGRQAYWVCTLIEESEALQAHAAEDTAELLAGCLPGLRVGLVHGRMKPAEKEAVMGAFKNGEIDLLVATTVIEVGVDVPNASLMIIENAERFGLAQLHQLRGRVGRGAVESSCLLMYHGPLSRQARERLKVMRETGDGFEVARKDLELRGPGEVLGTRQTGLMQFHIADVVRDQDLLPAVARASARLRREWPGSVEPLIRRWIGEGRRYGEV